MRVDAEAVIATVDEVTSLRPSAAYCVSRSGASTVGVVAEEPGPYTAVARLPAELDAGLDLLAGMDLDACGVVEVQRLLGEVNGRRSSNSGWTASTRPEARLARW